MGGGVDDGVASIETPAQHQHWYFHGFPMFICSTFNVDLTKASP